MRTLAVAAALAGLACGSAAFANPEQPASMKPIARSTDGYSTEVRAVMEDHVALAVGAPRPAAIAAEGFGAPASDLVSVPPARTQEKAACRDRTDPAAGRLVESKADTACKR